MFLNVTLSLKRYRMSHATLGVSHGLHHNIASPQITVIRTCRAADDIQDEAMGVCGRPGAVILNYGLYKRRYRDHKGCVFGGGSGLLGPELRGQMARRGLAWDAVT